MKRLTAILLLAAVCTAWKSSAQGMVQITFDGPPVLAPHSGVLTTNYDESGMSFVPIIPNDWDEAFGRSNGGTLLGGAALPDNGSTYLQALFGTTLMFSFADGSRFSLASVDLAGYSTVVPDFDIQFVGYRADGSTVTAEFTGTGIAFQTYSFRNLGFHNLTRVEIPTPAWSLDNLVVSVPEPGSLAILVLGAVILAFRTTRRTRS